jgi:hypothetical protein
VRKLLSVIALTCAVLLVAAPASADKDDDQRIAEEAGLKPSDLPDGWEAEPSTDLGEKSGVDECEAIDRVSQAALKVAYEESPLFTDNADPDGTTTIEGAVFVFPKPKAAKRYIAAYAADGARDCFQAIGDQAVEAYPSSEVGTADLDVSGGDDAVGYRLDLEGTDETGVTEQVVLDLVVVRQGRAVVSLGGQGVDEPPPLDDLLDTALDRLEQEL